MSTRCAKTENDREIDKKDNATNASKLLRTYIDAKNANSNFFDLTKICQRIRSISMRKDQIFSTLFVLFDRVSALQNRKCNDCIIRFLETILCDFNEYVMTSYNTFSRNCIVWLYSTFLRNDIIWTWAFWSIYFFEIILFNRMFFLHSNNCTVCQYASSKMYCHHCIFFFLVFIERLNFKNSKKKNDN